MEEFYRTTWIITADNSPDLTSILQNVQMDLEQMKQHHLDAGSEETRWSFRRLPNFANLYEARNMWDSHTNFLAVHNRMEAHPEIAWHLVDPYRARVPRYRPVPRLPEP
jgi:hypothetical protein